MPYALWVGYAPGRKRPVLGIARPGRVDVLASFRDEEAASHFVSTLTAGITEVECDPSIYAEKQ